MKKNRGYFFLFLQFIFCAVSCQISNAQEKWKYKGQTNFGCNLYLTRGPSQKFPGIRFFGAFIATANRGDFLLSYGPSLSIYTKTIGANLNPLVGDWQIDFTNTLAFGVEWGKRETYYKFTRSIHNGDFYNLVSNRAGLVLTGANFILNNHKRNQVLGSINATFGNVSISYYNDGPPFDLLGLADNFDRYWTGGFSILVHNKKGYNTMEMSFDQFTGYAPLLYELTGKLGLDIPLYSETKKGEVSNFNTSSYSLKLNFDQQFGINAGVVGSLKFGDRYFGLQEIIHVLGRYPMHPNNDNNRFFVGGTFNQLRNVKL